MLHIVENGKRDNNNIFISQVLGRFFQLVLAPLPQEENLALT